MIEFEQIPEKKVDIPVESEEQNIKEKAIEKLQKSQIETQVKAQAGIVEIPKGSEAIPPELPKYLFKCGSDVIACPKFQLDYDEAKLMAKHLSILTGNINSKWFSLIIILVVIISKVSGCMDAITRRFNKTKAPEPNKVIVDPNTAYNEQRNAQITG